MRGDEARNGRKRTEECELGNGGMRTGGAEGEPSSCELLTIVKHMFDGSETYVPL